jgi:hypothetical protein
VRCCSKFNVEGQEKWWYFKELLKKQEANKWQGADGGDLVWYWVRASGAASALYNGHALHLIRSVLASTGHMGVSGK